MEEKRYTYQLAPALPGEKDNNATRMARWERANNMKMRDLSMDEWIDVAENILPLTHQEVCDYLSYLMASQA